MKRYIILVTLVLLIPFSLTGCGEKKPKELLVFCGPTMKKPMSEIAKIIEEKENCKITFKFAGSGKLLKSLKSEKTCDLYLPGSDSYMKKCLEEGLVSDTVHVGYNKVAMLVQKGNPKGIASGLKSLTNKEYHVVLCNPNSAAVGREARKILKAAGIYDDVAANVRSFAKHVAELCSLLKDKVPDLSVCWYAVSTWPDIKPYVDVLPIDEKYAKKKKLVIGLLKTSENPELARKFMEYASSAEGRKLFTKYGLYDVK